MPADPDPHSPCGGANHGEKKRVLRAQQIPLQRGAWPHGNRGVSTAYPPLVVVVACQGHRGWMDRVIDRWVGSMGIEKRTTERMDDRLFQ